MVVVISAIVVTLLSVVVAEFQTECVLKLPTNGSRDVYCDVIPYKIDLSHTNNMTKLDVSGNDLNGLYITSNKNVTLPTLDLSRNNISDLCQVITGRAVKVDAMVLSFNEIKNFSMCSDTQNLTLRWNRIESLKRADMANASSLEVLDLGNNFILWIENDTFVGMPDLQWLDLKGNALTRISERTLPSTTLRYLDVSENYGLDRSTMFQPFENLVELNVARNAELAPVVLGSGPRLQALDASYTNLTGVPVTPAPLLGSLVLSGNAIRAVNSGDLDGFPLLRLLNISFNRIVAVEDDALGRLDLLTVLDLSGNALETVPRSLPGSLETLDLGGNKIRSLGAEDFEGCRRLRTLNVRGNDIRRVQDFALAPLVFLDSLDLSDNPIAMITREMLTGPVRLRVLKLERLPAPDTPAFPFTDTRYLARVQLAHSRRLAATLLNDTAVLSSVLQLEHLDLTGCAVTALPGRLPYYAPKMKTLRADGLACPGPPWLRDWLCEIADRRRRDRQKRQRQQQPAETELRLRRRRRRPTTTTTTMTSTDGLQTVDGVRCARDDDGRTLPVFDERHCAAITTTTATAVTTTKTTTTTTTTTTTASPTTTTTTTEQAAVFARLWAKDEAESGTRDVVDEAAHPGMVVFVSVVLLLVVLACGTVWIGMRGDALKRLHWKQNAANVDYQSIEIKSLESLNHVERW